MFSCLAPCSFPRLEVFCSNCCLPPDYFWQVVQFVAVFCDVQLSRHLFFLLLCPFLGVHVFVGYVVLGGVELCGSFFVGIGRLRDVDSPIFLLLRASVAARGGVLAKFRVFCLPSSVSAYLVFAAYH